MEWSARDIERSGQLQHLSNLGRHDYPIAEYSRALDSLHARSEVGRKDVSPR